MHYRAGYRALSLLAEEFNEIQADVYKRSLKLGKRNTGVVYYDLTNYFFEWEEEGGLVQFGHCKEGRPPPIIQMGLFMDHDGFPLAMRIEPGNKAETSTLKPMEERLKDKFGLSKLVVCTDGRLSSYENRKNNSVGDRSFITVQSLKKLKRSLQEWALERRIIITFSFKYRDYLAHVRNRQVTRAMALLAKGQGATSKRKSPKKT